LNKKSEVDVAKQVRPKAPEHLRAPTRRWWDSVVADFEMDPHHLRLLTLAGESWDRCAQAREALKRNGITFSDRFGQPKVRPEVAIERDSRIAFARLLRELNLDPDEPAESRPPSGTGRGHLRIAEG